MDLQLHNKVVLIAGSTDGLGLATALQLADEGANIVICGRDAKRLQNALKQLETKIKKEKLLGVCADLTQPEDIHNLVKQTAKQFGGIDIVITNAGGPKAASFENLSPNDIEKTFHLTLMSAVHLVRYALPYLKKSQAASVLTITSVSAKEPIAGLTLSNIFRPAVLGLTKSLSQELGPENIRVNSILPGFTATSRTMELLSTWAEQRHTSIPEEEEKRIETIPLKRIGKPEEFARVATFLVSPAASYINGVMLQVDGGACLSLL